MSTQRRRNEALAALGILASIATFAAAIGVFEFVFGQDPEKHLREQQTALLGMLAETPPSSLEFSAEGKTTIIREAAEISEFLRLLVEPPVVPRHHSHPEGEAMFQLQGSPATYRLGRDSQVPDEYWLQLDDGNASVRTIKLFHSAALTSWLVRHGLLED